MAGTLKSDHLNHGRVVDSRGSKQGKLGISLLASHGLRETEVVLQCELCVPVPAHSILGLATVSCKVSGSRRGLPHLS